MPHLNAVNTDSISLSAVQATQWGAVEYRVKKAGVTGNWLSDKLLCFMYSQYSPLWINLPGVKLAGLLL